MKTKTLITIALIVVLVGGVAYVTFGNFRKQESPVVSSPMMEESTKMEDAMDSDEMMKDTDATDGSTSKMASGGEYLVYSDQSIDSIKNEKRVLFFYADWCPTCRPVDQALSQNENKIPQNTTVIRVNYNDTATSQAEKDLAKKYQVTYQHTFVQIDSEGNSISKWNGGSLDELVKNIK